MGPRPPLPAVLVAALLVATSPWVAACGGAEQRTEPAAERAPRPKACPCRPQGMLGLLSDEGISIGKHAYHVNGDKAVALAFRDEGTLEIPLGLDIAFAYCGGEHEKRPVLYVAGCRQGDSVLRAFTDADGGGVTDDYLGEYVLPGTVRVVGLTPDDKGGLFAVDEIAEQILRLADTNADGIPDALARYATDTSDADLLRRGCDIWMEGGERLVVATGGCVLMDPIFLVVDHDGDGVPEHAGLTSFSYLRDGGPIFRDPPRVTDAAVMVETAPETTIEIWLADAAGKRTSEDPAVARVGRVEVGAAERVSVPLDRRLRQGEHVIAFDVAWKLSGPAARVHLDYPQLGAASPAVISRSRGGTVTVEGTGFSPDMDVAFVRHGTALPLRWTRVDETTIRVEIPPLDETGPSRPWLRVANANSPRPCRPLVLRLREDPPR